MLLMKKFLEFSNTIVVVFLAFLILPLHSEDLPSSFKKCGRKDPNYTECVKEASTVAIKILRNGLPEFGISAVDPLFIKTLSVDHNSGGPINLKQTYKNIKVYGFGNVESKSVKFNGDKCKYEINAKIPSLVIAGDYEAEGKVLLLPIIGKGKSNVTVLDNDVRGTIKCEEYEMNGDRHLRATTFRFEIMPKDAHLQFDNLFNDKTLSDNMNKFLNDNWKEILDEVKGGYEKAFGEIFMGLLNKIAAKVPTRLMFLS